MSARATVPLRRARPRGEVSLASLPPPLPRADARRDPDARSLLLRSLSRHAQQVELAKSDLSRARRALAGIAAAVEAVRGSLDRLALDVEVEGLTPRLASLQRRLIAELHERRRIEADRREEQLALERKLEHFRRCAAEARSRLSAVAA